MAGKLKPFKTSEDIKKASFVTYKTWAPRIACKEPEIIDKNPFKDFDYDQYQNRPVNFESLIIDEILFKSFRDAIDQNSHLIEGKIVIDVNCGCGILSIFMAKYAKKVFGIDRSDIVEDARKIAEVNDVGDVITFLRGDVRDIELPHGIKEVDIIISNWMGFSLFHECKLVDVLFARDKWLKSGGFLFPDRCCLYICGIENKINKEEIIDWYSRDRIGYDLRGFRKVALQESINTVVDSTCVITTPSQLIEIDLYTFSSTDLHFKAEFQLSSLCNNYIHALLLYFSVEFTKVEKKSGFSTAPKYEETHWKQTLFFLDDYLTVMKREMITGTFEMKANDKIKRDLDISIQLDFEGELCEIHEKNDYHLRSYN